MFVLCFLPFRFNYACNGFSCCFAMFGFACTVDQFNKKRVLLPQTLDISYSGVHGNKKFPTVEGPEVVRQGKRADVAWAGVEASRKFYFGILNFPVPESIEPAHMWIVDPRAGAGLRNFIFRF